MAVFCYCIFPYQLIVMQFLLRFHYELALRLHVGKIERGNFISFSERIYDKCIGEIRICNLRSRSVYQNE